MKKGFHSWFHFFPSGEWGPSHRLQGTSHLHALLCTSWMKHHACPERFLTVTTIPVDPEVLGSSVKQAWKKTTSCFFPGLHLIWVCVSFKPEVVVCLTMPPLQAGEMGPSGVVPAGASLFQDLLSCLGCHFLSSLHGVNFPPLLQWCSWAFF